MPETMTLIATTSLGSSASTIDFTAIPQTYTDLVLFISLRSASTGGQDETAIKLNGSSGNFTARRMMGLGTATSAGTSASGLIGWTNNAYSGWANAFLTIKNYTASTSKTYSCDWALENMSSGSAYDMSIGGIWADNTAITSITIYNLYSGTYSAGSMVSLYGILKGSGGATV